MFLIPQTEKRSLRWPINTDELIRHVTLDGPERGLLCLRVRDEIRMTIDAYKTLYDSSVTFGVKKQLQAEQGMAEMEEQVSCKLKSLFSMSYRVKPSDSCANDNFREGGGVA